MDVQQLVIAKTKAKDSIDKEEPNAERERLKSPEAKENVYKRVDDAMDQSEVQIIKEKQVDPAYERSVHMDRMCLTGTSSSPPESRSSESIRKVLKRIVENKDMELTFESVVEDLVRRKDTAIAQNESQPFKQPVKPKKVPVTRDHLDPVIQQLDPTASCSMDKYTEEDAVVEFSVTESDSSMDTDLVCAVSKTSELGMHQGQYSKTIVTFHWCNFCNFVSEEKDGLLQHVVKHRFHCKYCQYQSFSRVAVIKHGTEKHPAFSETEKNLQYCCYLPDVIQDRAAKKCKIADSLPDESTQSMKKAHLDSNDTDVTLKMEVEDVDVDQENESGAIVMHNSTANPPISLSPSSNLDSVQGQLPKAEEKHKNIQLPVISNIMSGEQVVSAVADITSGEQSHASAHTSCTSSAFTVGSVPTVGSSKYCLTCRYCKFLTFVPSILKVHLYASHPDQAYKYVLKLVSSLEDQEKIKASDKKISAKLVEATVHIINSTNTAPTSILQCQNKSFGVESDNSELDATKLVKIEETEEEAIQILNVHTVISPY